MRTPLATRWLTVLGLAACWSGTAAGQAPEPASADVLAVLARSAPSVGLRGGSEPSLRERRAAAQDMAIGFLDVTVPHVPDDPIRDDPSQPLDGDGDPPEFGEPIRDEPPPAGGDPPADRGDGRTPTGEGDRPAGGRPPVAGGPSLIAGEPSDLGVYPPNAGDERFIQPRFDLPGEHEFDVTVRGAPWATTIKDRVKLKGDGNGFVDLSIDTSGLTPGTYDGTVVLTCVDPQDRSVVEIPISIVVPQPPQFGADPADAKFGGLDAQGQPKSLDDLVVDVIDDIGASPFGQTANGKLVVDELRTWIGYFEYAVTKDGPVSGPRIPAPQFGTASDGDAVRPGEGQYVLSRGSGPLAGALASEEFTLGVDQSTPGIDEARKNPGDYYVFMHDGKMGVVMKADLVHTLPHEGLHALHAGKHNVGRAASNQEEQDAFRAGNAAAAALKLPPQIDAPKYGAQHPFYPPLFPPPTPPGPPPPPRVPPKPAGLPEGMTYASAAPATRVIPVLDSPAVERRTGSGGSGVVNAFDGVEVVVASRGGSTGDVLDLYAVNHGKSPVRLTGEGIVLEPVDDPSGSELARVDAIRSAASSGKALRAPERSAPGGGVAAAARLLRTSPTNVVRIPLDGYCLELRRDVPAEGALFRIAPRERQEAYAPARAILAASRRLHEEGGLRPDSDATAYFHSIRQWAVWVHQEDFGAAEFEREFVDHVRKNVEAAGRAWGPDAERQVRGLVPNRWNDLRAILEAAGHAPAGSAAAPPSPLVPKGGSRAG